MKKKYDKVKRMLRTRTWEKDDTPTFLDRRWHMMMMMMIINLSSTLLRLLVNFSGVTPHYAGPIHDIWVPPCGHHHLYATVLAHFTCSVTESVLIPSVKSTTYLFCTFSTLGHLMLHLLNVFLLLWTFFILQTKCFVLHVSQMYALYRPVHPVISTTIIIILVVRQYPRYSSWERLTHPTLTVATGDRQRWANLR